MKVWKIPTEQYLSKYGHPNGWVIVQDERDWDLGGITRGAQHQWSPKRWWEVQPNHLRSRDRRAVQEFATLREARAWCDENPRHPVVHEMLREDKQPLEPHHPVGLGGDNLRAMTREDHERLK